MALTLTISVSTCLAVILSVLFFPTVKLGKLSFSSYWAIACVGALLLLLTFRISPTELISELTADTAVNPLKILVLFLSMTALSVYLDEVGFFSYLAAAALRRAAGRQSILFLTLYLLVSVLTVFTSNDVIILTLTPFICYFAKNAQIDPLPYLIAEFIAANTWSMALIIGNPTNIYLASSAGITFGKYLTVMILPTILAGSVSLLVLLLLFRRTLAMPMQPIPAEVTFRRRAPLVIGLVHLSLCTLLLAVSSYLGLEMWLISLAFAVSLFLSGAIAAFADRRRPVELKRTLERLPRQLIPFVLSMFTVVLALKSYGVTDALSSLLSPLSPIPTYGILSFLSANLLNNIPMSVLFSEILNASAELSAPGVYATVIGSNIGAYLTPIGALAGIMWSSQLSRAGIRFSFSSFVKYGALISIPTLCAALIGLVIVL